MVGILKHVGFNRLGDYLLAGILEEEGGYCWNVRKELINEEYVQLKDFNPSKLEMTKCEGSKAYWQDRGDHVACSECGSAKFEEMEKTIDEVLSEVKGAYIERAKSYKFYLQNSSCKHLKFYTNHIPDEKIKDEEFLNRLSKACMKSRNVLFFRMEDGKNN